MVEREIFVPCKQRLPRVGKKCRSDGRGTGKSGAGPARANRV